MNVTALSRTSSLPRTAGRGFNEGASVGADLSAKTVIQSMNFGECNGPFANTFAPTPCGQRL
ncbi:hypothetical protein ALO93_102759 [Pseudomonas amygdali pv. sesami]|nr:hypothetical protein ALO93_102759 [Pseudomonas amygdali pv. sesami]